MKTESITFDSEKYKETTRQQWDTAAEAWHRWTPFLSRWLGPATETLLDRAEVGIGQRLLDIAAGTGDQSRQAAKRVGAGGSVLATDISEKVLEFAARDLARSGHRNVECRVLDGERLTPLPSQSFDAVISRVGLIYFPDRQKALAGMHRVLKPGGRIGAIVYASAERNPFFSIPVSVIRRRAKLPPPLPKQPGPFSLGAPGALESAFAQAGFRDIAVSVVSAPLLMKDASECVRFERESFGALHQMMAGLPVSEQDATWSEIETTLQRYETPEGFVGPCELVIATSLR